MAGICSQSQLSSLDFTRAAMINDISPRHPHNNATADGREKGVVSILATMSACVCHYDRK